MLVKAINFTEVTINLHLVKLKLTQSVQHLYETKTPRFIAN